MDCGIVHTHTSAGIIIYIILYYNLIKIVITIIIIVIPITSFIRVNIIIITIIINDVMVTVTGFRQLLFFVRVKPKGSTLVLFGRKNSIKYFEHLSLLWFLFIHHDPKFSVIFIVYTFEQCCLNNEPMFGLVFNRLASVSICPRRINTVVTSPGVACLLRFI